MSLSAPSANDRAQQILALTERLNARLLTETEALTAHRPQDIHAGIEETRQLSNLYRVETARIKADPSLLSGLSADPKSKLRSATETFQETAKRHAIAVTAAKTVTEGILQTIAIDVADRKVQTSTYGPGAKRRVTGPASLNMNHKA